MQRILLVEDNPYDAELTMVALKRSNLANPIDIVTDGEQALEYLFRTGEHEGRPDGDPGLILLDVKLPKLDGMEVLRQIKADEQLRRIPVIVMTSSVDDKDAMESYHLGVNAYLEKPLDLKRFHQAISKLGVVWFMYTEQPGSEPKPKS